MKILRSARGPERRQRLRAVIGTINGAIDFASIMVGVLVIGIIGAVIAATVFAVVPFSQDRAAQGNLTAAGQAERAARTTGNTVFLRYDSTDSGHRDLESSSPVALQRPDQRLIVDTNASGTAYLAAQLSQTGQVWLASSEDPTPRMATDSGYTLTSYTGRPAVAAAQMLAAPAGLVIPLGIASAVPQNMIHALVTRGLYFPLAAVSTLSPPVLTVFAGSGSMNTATVDYAGPTVRDIQDSSYADLAGLHIRLAVDAGAISGAQPGMESVAAATGDTASSWVYGGTSVAGGTRYFDYARAATLVPDSGNPIKRLFGFRMSFALVSPAPAGSMPPPPTAVPIQVIVSAASTIAYNAFSTPPPCVFSNQIITCG